MGRRIRIRLQAKLPAQQPPRPAAPRRQPPRPVQHAAATVGAVFGLFGLLGFLPGLTVHMEELTVAGEQTRTLLFGLFAVSVLHNVIHLLLAVAGLAMATSARLARWYLLAGGAVNLIIALLGVTPAADAIPVNGPDAWLQLVLGAAMLGLSLLPGKRRS